MRGIVWKQGITKGYEETFKGNACIHHPDCGSLIGIEKYQILSNCAFQI